MITYNILFWNLLYFYIKFNYIRRRSIILCFAPASKGVRTSGTKGESDGIANHHLV